MKIESAVFLGQQRADEKIIHKMDEEHRLQEEALKIMKQDEQAKNKKHEMAEVTIKQMKEDTVKQKADYEKALEEMADRSEQNLKAALEAQRREDESKNKKELRRVTFETDAKLAVIYQLEEHQVESEDAIKWDNELWNQRHTEINDHNDRLTNELRQAALSTTHADIEATSLKAELTKLQKDNEATQRKHSTLISTLKARSEEMSTDNEEARVMYERLDAASRGTVTEVTNLRADLGQAEKDAEENETHWRN